MNIQAKVHQLYRPMEDFTAATDVCSTFLLLILVAGFVHAAYYLFLGIANPLLDLYSFRQTQTALSAYWMWRGGPWFAYETPVLGYPWAIPYEFPIYQGLIAILRTVGIPIDIGGRLLSFGFYIGCLWPLLSLFRTIKLPQTAFLTIAALFLWSPIYVYWDRTVLIDPGALFFCLVWLALLARFMRTASISSFVGAMLAGLAGMLCKVTTFPAVAAIAGILFLAETYRAWFAGTMIAKLRVLALTIALVIVPLAAEILWVAFSDAIKAQNPFGSMLTSKALFNWNFGTWQQRIDPELWRTIWDRSLPDIFGTSVIMAFFIAGIGLLSRRYIISILSAALAFMIPFLIFTNLHIIHSFYQIANSVFILAAIGIAIIAIAETWHKALAPLLVAVIVCGQVYFFHRNYAPIIAADFSNNRTLRIAQLAREKTNPTDSLIVIGQDWSSVVAYYSERKSLTIPWWMPYPLTQKVFNNPQAFLGSSRLGGVVICSEVASESAGDLIRRVSKKFPLVTGFLAGRAVIGEVQGCQLLARGQ